MLGYHSVSKGFGQWVITGLLGGIDYNNVLITITTLTWTACCVLSAWFFLFFTKFLSVQLWFFVEAVLLTVDYLLHCSQNISSKVLSSCPRIQLLLLKPAFWSETMSLIWAWCSWYVKTDMQLRPSSTMSYIRTIVCKNILSWVTFFKKFSSFCESLYFHVLAWFWNNKWFYWNWLKLIRLLFH